MLEVKEQTFTRTVAVLNNIEGDLRPTELEISDPIKTPLGTVVQARPIKADGTKGKILFKDLDILQRDIDQAKALQVGIFTEAEPSPTVA